MLNIAIIPGTSRPQALNPQIVSWVEQQLASNDDVRAEVVDFGSFDLPLLDEVIPAGAKMYANDHTKAWGAKLEEFDAFIFVTPEYNHSISGSLKNALDFVATEFNHKVAGIVNYGADKGVRAAEHLRHILANYKLAVVRDQASFSIFTDVADGTFAPTEVSAAPFASMVDDIVAWGEALKSVREAGAEEQAA
ncbi:NAD(P)H-dependent FMN reductase [Brevibacterium iodinum ATCC 49514]|uniref:NAD(P)H-dependent FMN reductase n=2 Tax=Brevibacterium TaxID=1696 RepID=A0A2H1JSX5_BRELN|nr:MULTISPECIES: NAD(P)H-dependent oxidoreductase [Brevibacterium]KAB1947126.1 NAD(P)H-dependent oxidoreductase [Brevibacterium linens ATCC 9172]MCS4592809.1 NAD(P)H-dependent oxidoreductase [Brevibacterium sediminis]UZD61989.1 NAD(P)H-dependent oxidoreductase [Brevibacterium sp. JSBI002]SMX68124.1 NAD(P)H-dependent FMN reductase [Brevibacterium iodinum ATCC 49514]SMX90596.1 NAD(P)H-dependent FMN reductase [Brevibacterium linens ATCC 9172]